MRQYDAIVVGAGPAGSASAAHLADAGLEVLLVDRARFPRDKVCGEYLSPGCRPLLARLGTLDAVEGAAAPLRGMRVHAYDGAILRGEFPRPDGPNGGSGGLAIPRYRLDQILLAQALGRPIEYREAFRVTGPIVEGGRIVGIAGTTGAAGATPERIRSRLVIAADGRGSVIARRLGLHRRHPWLQKMALVTHLEGVEEMDSVGEIFLDRPGYCILNPLPAGLVNAGLVIPFSDARGAKGDVEGFFAATLARFPRMAPFVKRARIANSVRCVGPLAFRAARLSGPGLLLVGDAAGFLDPFTGEGIHAALRSAQLAARVAVEALRSGGPSGARLARYDRLWRGEVGSKWALCTLLQRILPRPWLASAVARHLAARDDLRALVFAAVGDLIPPHELSLPRLLPRLLATPMRRTRENPARMAYP